jgi:hypothetical protein
MACEKYANATAPFLNDLSVLKATFTETHSLVGPLAALAECQKHFPEIVETRAPLQQSLDMAAYI